jgi:phage terminase large subunit GpA-like protein
MSVLKFLEGERRIYRKFPPIKLSEWAVKNLIIQDGPYRGARMRTDVNPYLQSIMDAYGDPRIEEVCVCGSPQTGKTLAMYGCLAYSMERRPGTKMLAMPDDKVLSRVEAEKLLPLIRNSPVLRKLVSKSVSGHLRLVDGSSIFLSSAQAPAQRASITVRDLFLDEEDLYVLMSGKGDTVTDFLERTRSYSFGRKIMRVSKPVGSESSSIWTKITKGVDQLYCYEVKCPRCGQAQFFAETSVKAIKKENGSEADANEIIRLGLGRYECFECHALWTDQDKALAVQAGQWRSVKPGEPTETGAINFEVVKPIERVKSVGFHLPAILSQTVSLSELASRKKLSEASEDNEYRQTQANGDWARPYIPVKCMASASNIMCRVEPWLMARRVPPGAIALTCGIDTQMRGFYYLVLAWMPNQTKYVIDYGQLESFQAVEELVFKRVYPFQETEGEPKGEGKQIWRAAIDSGGSTHDGIYSRTQEVYEFVRQFTSYNTLFATKGASHDQMTAVRWTYLDKMPGKQSAIPLGLALYLLDTNKIKSNMFYWLLNDGVDRPIKLYGQDEEIQPETLHNELVAHLMAERQVLRPDGKTEWKLIDRNNHYLDCLAMACACGDLSWTPSLHHAVMAMEAEAKMASLPMAPMTFQKKSSQRMGKSKLW